MNKEEKQENTLYEDPLKHEKMEQNETAEYQFRENEQGAEQTLEKEQVDPLQILENKLEASNDRYLRLAAEFENYKRRTQQQIQQQLRYANEPLIRLLLGPIDHLEQALDAGKKALETGDDSSLKTLLDGVDMVRNQLLETLQQFGVRCLTPIGQPFDPNHQEAVSEREDFQQPPGRVLEQLQAGYMLYERLLRPARVVVAKAVKQSS